MENRLLVLFSLMISSCSSGPTQVPDKSVIYEKDLRMEINGEKIIGVAAVYEAPLYEFEVKSFGKNDYILFKSCNRDKALESEGRKVEYVYAPVQGIEDNAHCPLEIVSLDKKGRHGWGFIVFQDSQKYGKAASQRCNGSQGTAPGVSVCQGRYGLIQDIEFDEPMLYVSKGNCVMEVSDNKKRFRYTLSRGNCVFNFGSVSKPHTFHLHYTLGYDERLLRK